MVRELRSSRSGCGYVWGRCPSAIGAGGSRSAGLLRERLEAGWRLEQIWSVVDQGLPSRVGRLSSLVGRLSSLVAKRLELNVVPGMAPLESAEIVRRSEAEMADGVSGAV